MNTLGKWDSELLNYLQHRVEKCESSLSFIASRLEHYEHAAEVVRAMHRAKELNKKVDIILTEDNVLSVDFKNKEPRLALIPGGPSGPENWLTALPRGTIFLAKKKSENADMLYKYLVLEHLTNSTNMLWAVPDGKNLDIWVATLDFSRKYAMHEVAGRVGLPEDQEQEQVNHEQVQSVVSGVEGSSATQPPEDASTGN